MNTSPFLRSVAQKKRIPGLASVIVPSYNKAPFVEATLDSIANQTYPQLEIVIVDDASSDDSVERIRAWSTRSKRPVQLSVHATNKGVCATLNDGLRVAQGEFVAALAADDLYLPHKIASHVALLRSYPTASMVYGDARMEDVGGRVLAPHAPGRNRSGDLFMELLAGNFITAAAVTMRGSSLDSVGLYDESLPYEDYDMWLRMAKVGEIVCSGTVDAVYLDAPGSLSKRLGRNLDVGHLQMLAKYRADPAVDRTELDSLARRYVRRLARQDASHSSPIAQFVATAKAAWIYGDSQFVVRMLSSEVTQRLRHEFRRITAR